MRRLLIFLSLSCALTGCDIFLPEAGDAFLRHRIKDATNTEGPPIGMEFSPDGTLLVWCSETPDASLVHINRVDDGQFLTTFDGIDHTISDIAISNDNNILAISANTNAGSSNTIHLWDLNSESALPDLAVGLSQGALAFNQDGTILAGVVEQGIRLWNTSDWSEFKTIDLEQSVNSMQFLAGGDLLYAADGGGRINPSTEEIAWTVQDASGQVTLSADESMVMFLAYSQIYIHDSEEGQETGQLHRKTGDDEDIVAAAFSPGNKRVVGIGRHGSLTIWDLEGTHQIITNKREVVEYQVNLAAFSTDGYYLATPDLFWLVINDP